MSASAVLDRVLNREKDTSIKENRVKNQIKERLNVVLSPRSMNRLEYLKEKTDASSYTEVFKNALRLYDALISEKDKGSELYIKDKEGNLIAYKIFN